MAATIVLPRLGWTMEEGTLVEWLKCDGDSIAVGDKLFVMEGDKATEEIEAIDAGVLRIPPDSPPLGSIVPVGTVLAYLCAPSEPDLERLEELVHCRSDRPPTWRFALPPANS